jgi:hypothetical protein
VLSFEIALELIKKGHPMSRKGWRDGDNPEGMTIELFKVSGQKYLTFLGAVHPEGHPLYPRGHIEPWTPTHSDMLTDDWF